MCYIDEEKGEKAQIIKLRSVIGDTYGEPIEMTRGPELGSMCKKLGKDECTHNLCTRLRAHRKIAGHSSLSA